MISCKEYAEFKKSQIKNVPKHMPLSIIQVGNDFGSAAYVRGKLKDCEEVGIQTYLYKVDDTITQDEFGNLVMKAALNNGGIIVTMPLPSHLHIRKEWLKPWQDVDGLCYNYYNSCTAEGIVNWLKYNDYTLYSPANYLVIGEGNVGKPLAKMLIDNHCNVSVCNSHMRWYDLAKYIDNANIIISTTGKHDYLGLEEEYSYYVFSENHVNWDKTRLWIDVGINTDENGKICGDLAYDWLVSHKQEVTPVPGGVGLLTRVTLLDHLTACE